MHAAFTSLGFLHWKIFEETVDHSDVAEFINELAPLLTANSVGLFENALNQRTNDIRNAINNAFAGKYFYCAAYSPHLKPIEHAFFLVRNYIQTCDQDLDYINNPEELINKVFARFKVGSEHASVLYNEFFLYRNNHAMYLDQLN